MPDSPSDVKPEVTYGCPKCERKFEAASVGLAPVRCTSCGERLDLLRATIGAWADDMSMRCTGARQENWASYIRRIRAEIAEMADEMAEIRRKVRSTFSKDEKGGHLCHNGYYVHTQCIHDLEGLARRIRELP